MRRILGPFALLVSVLIVAGCGSSNSNSEPHAGEPSVASLKGQYVFQEQVYTYLAAGLTAPRRGQTTRHYLAPIKHVPTLARREQRVQAALAMQGKMHPHPVPGSVKKALPDSGNGGDTNVSWGAEVGTLTFDGDGHVTAGELDFNEPTDGGYYSEAVTGTYTMDPHQVGTISLTGASTGMDYEYQMTLQGGTGVATGSIATGAQLQEGEEDDAGDVQIGVGQMLEQASGVAQSTLTGNYIFGVQGVTCLGCSQATTGDIYAAGVLAADGAGTFGTSGEADIATAFQTDDAVGISGTYGAPDGEGRATATLTATGYTNGALPSGYVIYIASSSTAFIMSTDSSSTSGIADAFLFGEMNQQSGTFTNATLTGNAVVAETTEDLVNETSGLADTDSDAFLALLTANGGTVTGTGDLNHAGTISSGVAVNYGAYTVASNGRVTLTGTTPAGAPAPVFYLSGTGIGYGVDQLFGADTQEPGLLFLYQQTGSNFSNASLNGYYAFGDLPGAISNVGLNATGIPVGPGFVNGDLQADGNGNVTGEGFAEYINGDGGSGDFNGTYSISANGRGTITGSSSDPTPLLGDEVMYLTSDSMALAMDVTPGDSSPDIQIIQQ